MALTHEESAKGLCTKNSRAFMEQEETHQSHVDNAALSTLPFCAGNRVWAIRLVKSSAEVPSRPQAAKEAHQRL